MDAGCIELVTPRGAKPPASCVLSVSGFEFLRHIGPLVCGILGRLYSCFFRAVNAGRGNIKILFRLRELEDICDHVGIMKKGKMLVERSLADMQGSTVKLQMVGEAPRELNVLHKASSGRLNTYIVRGSIPRVQAAVERLNPAYFDILPLSLEEIFIYELGGADHEAEGLLL